MTQAPDRSDADALASIERQLRDGERDGATKALILVLEACDDPACRLAARLFRLWGEPPPTAPPDALAATLDRLVQLVGRQDEQIRTLRALVEDAL